MTEMSLKLQLDGIEQQIKILKAKMLKKSSARKMSDLFGSFEGQMDLSQDEIREFEYSSLGNL